MNRNEKLHLDSRIKYCHVSIQFAFLWKKKVGTSYRLLNGLFLKNIILYLLLKLNHSFVFFLQKGRGLLVITQFLSG